MNEELDLDALQRLADAATPGPWEADDNRPFSRELQGIFAPALKRYVLKVEFDEQPDNPADAEFIAAARTAIPALLARVRELERDAALSTIAKVREAHVEVSTRPNSGYCATCTGQSDLEVEWPCPTIRALGSVPSTGEGNE